MKDTRAQRKTLAIFIAAGAAAVIGQRLLEPKIKRTLKVRK